jgi:hypothetical protein
MNAASQLFDSIKQASRDTAQMLRTDADLATALDVDPPVISKIRTGNLPLGATLLIRIHELTGWAIRDIKGALGMPCLASRA